MPRIELDAWDDEEVLMSGVSQRARDSTPLGRWMLAGSHTTPSYEVPRTPADADWDPRDPLRGPSTSACYWTTHNVGEGVQGIPTPLTFSWYHVGSEIALRRCWGDLGVLPSSDQLLPAQNDRRFLSVAMGRFCLNVDVWRSAGDLMPGSSGNAVEEQFFGSVRSGQVSHPSRRRYPVVAAKFPSSLYLKQRRVSQIRVEFEQWRRDALRSLEHADVAAAMVVLDDALQRFIHDTRHHVAASMLSQSFYEGLSKLAGSVGKDGLELALTTGYGSLEESAVLSELWRRARAGDEVVAIAMEYGYYGTNTGELSSVSWREDAGPVIAIAERYRMMDEDRSPQRTESRQLRRRLAAEAELLAALPVSRRAAARVLMSLAAKYLPLREVGRASMLMAVDVGRAAARLIGSEWASTGRLAAADDIFYLTHQEILADQVPADIVAYRKERGSYYESIEIPEAWQGVPEVWIPDQTGDTDDVVVGLGANGGLVEGVVRVMTDQNDADFEDGEILVCKTTDPSWASLLLMAGAAVIDIGGPLSHGAIVARELGIPCVIGTKDGTRRLRTGDVVRVDGGAGRVERIKQAEREEH